MVTYVLPSITAIDTQNEFNNSNIMHPCGFTDEYTFLKVVLTVSFSYSEGGFVNNRSSNSIANDYIIVHSMPCVCLVDICFTYLTFQDKRGDSLLPGSIIRKYSGIPPTEPNPFPLHHSEINCGELKIANFPF